MREKLFTGWVEGVYEHPRSPCPTPDSAPDKQRRKVCAWSNKILSHVWVKGGGSTSTPRPPPLRDPPLTKILTQETEVVPLCPSHVLQT